MDRLRRCLLAGMLAVVLSAAGCQSPYHADRGALFGGLLGAGTGAIIGDAVGNAGAGTAIGAGLGALTGAAVGEEMDQIEAQNRAMIEAQLGRQVTEGAVTIDDVIAMSRAGVDDELIVTHIRANGVAHPLSTQDLISLQQQGVSTRVVKAMQEPPQRKTARPVVVRQVAPVPVIVEEYPYGPSCLSPPEHFWFYRHPPRRSGIGWGLSFHN